MKKCPHEHVQFCPLYVAGHVVGLPTCMGKWDFMGCDVDHGRKDYGQLVAALFRADATMVSECAEHENAFEAGRQPVSTARIATLH